MLFLLTNVGKVWVFLGISLGKVVGMEWQAEGLPPGGGETHTFLTLVNKNNILYSIGVIYILCLFPREHA